MVNLRKVILSFGILGVVTACVKKEALKTDTLRFALGAEPPTLDSTLADTGVSILILKQTLSTLFQYDEAGKIVPFDAETFEWSKDAKELRIKIRTDLKWSDGVPVTACQYRDTFLHLLSPSHTGTLSDLLYDIRGAESFKKADHAQKLAVSCDDQNFSLVIEVITPYSFKTLSALAFISTAPFRKDRFEKLNEKWIVGDENHPPIASGAFVIKEWRHDRSLLLEARSLTETALPKDRLSELKYIQIPIVKDPTTAFSMYESNELDFLEEIPPTVLPKILERSDRVITPYPTTYFVGYSFQANPVLKDSRVRKALAFSARQSEIPTLLKGGESAAYGWIYPDLLPKKFQSLNLDSELQKGAAKLLDTAGFKDRKKFPKLQLQYNGGERHQLLMERLAYLWKTELGIEVKLQPVEWKLHVAQLKNKAPDLYRYAWTAVYPDPLFFLELFHSESMNNFGKWKNVEYDKILQELKVVPLHLRDDIFFQKIQRMQEILVREDPAMIPVYHYVRNALVKKHVKGLRWGIEGMGSLNKVRIVHSGLKN